MTDLLLDNHTLPSLPYHHHAPRPQNITDHSPKPQDKPLPSAPTSWPPIAPNQNAQTSRRYARVWDPAEVTEALRTFTPPASRSHHTDTTQCAKPRSALGQEKIYLIRDRKPVPTLRLVNKEAAPPVPPKDRVVLRTNPQSQRVLTRGIRAQDPAPTCSICLDNTNLFPRRGPTSRCAHPPTICTPCLEEYISHSVLTDGLTLITCPIPDCRQILEHEDVVRGANGDQTCLKRYETLLVRRALENDPNFVQCKSPTCSWGQIHQGGAANPLVTCEQCNSQSCFTHNIPWHTGLTCKQFDDNARNAGGQRSRRDRARTENRKSEKYIRSNTKRCPNSSCGRQIQKDGGCDHMTCRRPAGCGHEFCWFCRADYALIHWKGNQRHKIYCKHYRPHWPKKILRMRWYSS
ncbi:hypothetical protein ACGC1H_000966 [Rhizoctonia solani]